MSAPRFVEQEPEPGREVEAREGTTIGRDGCDVGFEDPELSRRHARIRLVGSAVAIEDLGSTNGTFVNDERIAGVRELVAGDVVRFGHTVWKLEPVAAVTTVAQSPAPAAPVATPAAPEEQRRGDVPAPDRTPTAIRRVVPPASAPAAFDPAPPPRSRGSAATRLEATVAAYLVTGLVAAGVLVYYITKPFE